MKKLFFYPWICLSILIGLNFVFAQETQKESSKEIKEDQIQPKYALLVGVSKFKNSSIPKIDGCQNNVPLLAKALEKYGFKEENILSLMDEKAGKSAILENFRTHLINNAEKAKKDNKEAVIVYYFCGHGSQYPDQDKDENDLKDETFVAYDSRTDDVFDILDDEIDDLKAELRLFTNNTTLILEACNSGTGTRNGLEKSNYVVQEIKEDTRKRPPYKRKYNPTEDSDSSTYTELSASQSDRKSLSETEESCDCKTPYSLMTKALVEGLERATYNTTYRGLIKEVSTEVARQSQQEPQVEGNRDAILFKGAAKRANPYIEIEKILPDNQIIIKAGTIHGLKVGSQVSIYSSDSLTNTGEQGWLTNGLVTEIGNSLSKIQLPKENEKVKDVKIASHVILASPVFGGGSILFNVNEEIAKSSEKNDLALQTKLQKQLSTENFVKSKIVQLVESEISIKSQKESAKAVVRLRKGKIKDIFGDENGKIKDISEIKKYVSPNFDKTFCQGDELKVRGEEERYPLLDKEVYYLDDGEFGGIPLNGKTFDPADNNVVDDIINAVKDFAYRQNLRALDNAASNLGSQIEINLQYIPGEAIIEKCEKGEKKYTSNKEKFKGFIDIKDNKVPVDSYFYLKVKNISGVERRKTTEFASGGKLYISIIGLTNDGKIKNFYGSKGANDAVADEKEISVVLKTKEPVGIERYIIVVSKDYVDFSFYESTGARRDPKSILEQVLTQSGQQTRNAGTVIKDEPDKWDVISLDIDLVDRVNK